MNLEKYPQIHPHFVKVKIFQGRFVVFLPSCEIWSDCNTSNHAPSCGLAFALFPQPSDIAFRAAFVCIASVGSCAQTKKAHIDKKVVVTVVTVVTALPKPYKSGLSR